MAEELELPEDLSDGDRLDVEGQFHFMVLEVNEQPQKETGELIDGTEFRLQVLSGNVPGQKGKSLRVTLYNGNLSHKDRGKFKTLCKARMALALDLIKKDMAGKTASINWMEGVGRQIIATIGRNNNGYPEIDGPKIYHVTDEAVAAVPKDLAAIQKFMGIDPATLPKAGDAAAADAKSAPAKAPASKPAADKPSPAKAPTPATTTMPTGAVASNPNAWDL